MEDLLEVLREIKKTTSYEKMGRVFNISSATIRRWLEGTHKMSRASEFLIRTKLQKGKK